MIAAAVVVPFEQRSWESFLGGECRERYGWYWCRWWRCLLGEIKFGIGGEWSFNGDDDVVVVVETDKSSGEYARSWAANDDQSAVGSRKVGDIAVGVFKISSIRKDDNGCGWDVRYGRNDGVYTEQFILLSYLIHVVVSKWVDIRNDENIYGNRESQKRRKKKNERERQVKSR